MIMPEPSIFMSLDVVQQLLHLNQEFYRRFAREFSSTRGPLQPGWQRLLAWLPVQGSLLDVGCGNGRLAHLLDRAGRPVAYVGVDGTAELLAEARPQASDLEHVRTTCVLADITMPGWEQHLPQPAFTAVALLAVLHHLPGWRLRRQVIAGLATLLEPGGLMVISTWQFMNSARLRRKIVPWETIGLEPDQVEANDFLLDWKRGGYGLRYCHLVDVDEVFQLAAAAGLTVHGMFRDDGREGDLNLFAALRVG
jgi:tRNA (uracil-5-)-methyltransferase TRM9